MPAVSTPYGETIHRGGKSEAYTIPETVMGVDQTRKLQEMHRRMQIQLNVLPTRGKIALGVALFLSLLTYGSIFYYFFYYNHVSDMHYLETQKCPACYGQSLCNQLQYGMGKLTGYSRLQFLNSLANVKNVNYGMFGGKEVVFKKLAHTYELDEFDQQVCKEARTKPQGDRYIGSSCDVKKAMPLLVGGSKTVTIAELKDLSDLTRCPSQRLVDNIVDKYKEKADAIDISYPEKIQLITTLRINPEPLFLQMFHHSDGYPFPEYLGACGRHIVVENVGRTLTEFYDAPWEERIDYATQIFRLAELFTNPVTSFALYWTDLSYDNFAVDSRGKVRMVDVENIIVVDKWNLKLQKKPGWDEPFYVPFDECVDEQYGTCLSVYSTDLCGKVTTDHNYYAACRNLLSSYGSEKNRPGGLLHGTPKAIEEKYGIDAMLRECAKPSKPGARLEIKDELLAKMEEIRKKLM